MKKSLAIMIFCLLCAANSFGAEDEKIVQQDKEHDFIKELSYRQREYQNQYLYLSEKESKIAAELNDEISTQNESPTAISLQRIDNLKARLLEYLQDQIKNDRDYVRYLEMRLSELLDYKFPTLKAVQEFEADTAITIKPLVQSSLDKGPAASAAAPEDPKEYKRERIPLTIEDGAKDDAAFREAQGELNRMERESLEGRKDEVDR